MIVGHLPWTFAKILTSILLSGGGAIKVQITRKTENPRGQGLEVPCKVIIKMPNYAFVKADVVIRDICSRNKW